MEHYSRVSNFSDGTATRLNITVEATNKQQAKDRAEKIFNSIKEHNSYNEPKTVLKDCHHTMIENKKHLFCFNTNTY